MPEAGLHPHCPLASIILLLLLLLLLPPQVSGLPEERDREMHEAGLRVPPRYARTAAEAEALLLGEKARPGEGGRFCMGTVQGTAADCCPLLG